LIDQLRVSVVRVAALVAGFIALVVLLGSAPADADARAAFRTTGTIGEPGQFGAISGIAVRPDGQMVLADSQVDWEGDQNQHAYWFSDSETFQTIAVPSGGGGWGMNAVAVPPTGNTFYADNTWDGPIRQYDRDGTELLEVPGATMWSNSLFAGNPGPGNVDGLALAGNLLYAISDRSADDPIGAISTWQLSTLGDPGANYGLVDVYEGPPAFGRLVAIALDASGNVYVVDYSNGKLTKFDPDFDQIWSVGEKGTGATQFGYPLSMAIDSENGIAYVVDIGTDDDVDPYPAGPRLLRFDISNGATLSPILLESSGNAVAIDPTTGDLLLSLQTPEFGGSTVYRGVVSRQPIISLRKKPARKTRSRVARFRFASDEPGTRFSCRLDSKRFKRCTSRVTFRKLKRGRHTLRVKGTVSDGVPSAVRTYRWRVR
jgi:DNA-binding beta-propeller fold protein YncE